MYLGLTHKKSNFPSFTSPFKKESPPFNFDVLTRSFDETLLRRLKALSQPSITLAWLSRAVDLLSATHADALTVISALKPSPDDSLSLYIDHSIKLLDLCNSISSQIERLRHRRLSVKLALHLLAYSGDNRNFPETDKLRRARDSLSGWEDESTRVVVKRGFGQVRDPGGLVRDLAEKLEIAPHGKISTAQKVIRRTIYAAGAITVFVAGVLVAVMCGEGEVGKAVRVDSAEFLWADSFNALDSAVNAELKRRGEKKDEDKNKKRVFLTEVDDVEKSVELVRNVIDGVVLGDEEKKERLGNAVKEMDAVTQRLTEGLDRLGNGVRGMFHAVLTTRNGVVDRYRIIGHEKQMK